MCSKQANNGTAPGLIREQNVPPEKTDFARALRREMSPVERVLWGRLRAKQLSQLRFRRQQVIGPYIADFYCAEAELAVEVDGDTHNQEYDAERDRFFRDKGISVLRFTNRQVLHETEGVL